MLDEITIRIAKMNLAVHGLEGKIAEAITYYQDDHNLGPKKALEPGGCGFVMANPPFNLDLVDAERIKGDARFGLPGVNKQKKVGNGNYLIPWVSSGEMTELRIYDTPLHISEEGAIDGSRLVPANTVLAVARGMSLAKEFRVSITKREVAFNQDLKALACDADMDSEFLFYALLARRGHIRELASEASHGKTA